MVQGWTGAWKLLFLQGCSGPGFGGEDLSLPQEEGTSGIKRNQTRFPSLCLLGLLSRLYTS